MIIEKDIHPERKVYYLGALVLEILKESPEKAPDFLYVYQKINERQKVSMKLFILTLDWLFLLGAIDTKKGCIEKCF